MTSGSTRQHLIYASIGRRALVAVFMTAAHRPLIGMSTATYENQVGARGAYFSDVLTMGNAKVSNLQMGVGLGHRTR